MRVSLSSFSILGFLQALVHMRHQWMFALDVLSIKTVCNIIECVRCDIILQVQTLLKKVHRSLLMNGNMNLMLTGATLKVIFYPTHLIQLQIFLATT